jgi:hypothetical protein
MWYGQALTDKNQLCQSLYVIHGQELALQKSLYLFWRTSTGTVKKPLTALADKHWH